MINHRIELGKLIKTVRLAKGYTLDHYLKASNAHFYSETTIKNIERGMKSVKEETIYDVVNDLGIIIPRYAGTDEEYKIFEDWIDSVSADGLIDDTDIKDEIIHLDHRFQEARILHAVTPFITFIHYLPFINKKVIKDISYRITCNSQDIDYIVKQLNIAILSIEDKTAKSTIDSIISNEASVNVFNEYYDLLFTRVSIKDLVEGIYIDEKK